MSTWQKINKAEFDFHFITKKRMRLTGTISAILVIIAIISLLTRGLNFGIDFTGGTLLEVGYKDNVELIGIRTVLKENHYADAVVQHFGTPKDVLIRLGVRENVTNDKLSNEILTLLRTQNDNVTMRRVEFVGPQVGQELIEDGGLAMLYTLIGILIYVAIRFEKRFALGAVAALLHDSIITLGVFSIFALEFDLTILAAILAIIGYSLNDTIVVFDRIRDNFLKLRKSNPEVVMNRSINQTLIRTLITSITTLLVVVSLFFLGGQLIHGFATALLIGIIVGTYSSIYVASSVTLYLGVSKADMMPVEKEGADLIDDRL
jgi:preprotein translocase subunit SecF